MILTLEQSVDVSIRDKFRDYFVTTIMGVTMLYITFGAAGYLSYGPETKDIITLNLPANGVGPTQISTSAPSSRAPCVSPSSSATPS